MKKLSLPILSLLLAGLIILAGFWLAVLPQMRSFADLQKQYSALGMQDVGQETTTTKPKIDQVKLQALQNSISILLPASDGQYDFAIQLDALSKSMGITLTSVSITNPSAVGATTTSGIPKTSTSVAAPDVTANQGIKKLTFVLGLTAKYGDVQRFMQGLLSLNRFVQIDQITLTAVTVTVPASSGNPASSSVSDQLTAQIGGYAAYSAVPVTATIK